MFAINSVVIVLVVRTLFIFICFVCFRWFGVLECSCFVILDTVVLYLLRLLVVVYVLCLSCGFAIGLFVYVVICLSLAL